MKYTKTWSIYFKTDESQTGKLVLTVEAIKNGFFKPTTYKAKLFLISSTGQIVTEEQLGDKNSRKHEWENYSELHKNCENYMDIKLKEASQSKLTSKYSNIIIDEPNPMSYNPAYSGFKESKHGPNCTCDEDDIEEVNEMLEEMLGKNNVHFEKIVIDMSNETRPIDEVITEAIEKKKKELKGKIRKVTIDSIDSIDFIEKPETRKVPIISEPTQEEIAELEAKYGKENIAKLIKNINEKK